MSYGADMSSGCVSTEADYKYRHKLPSEDSLQSIPLDLRGPDERMFSSSEVSYAVEGIQEAFVTDKHTSMESVFVQANKVETHKRGFYKKRLFWKTKLNSNPSETDAGFKLSRTHSLPDILESISNSQAHSKTIFGRTVSRDDLDQHPDDVFDTPPNSPCGTNSPICGTKHRDEPSYFCLKDNEIYCNVCVRIHNYNCAEHAKYISEISQEECEKFHTDTRNNLLSMKYRFEKVKEENETKLDVLKTDRHNYLHSVMKFTEKVMEILRCLEKDTLEAMNALYTKETKRHDVNLIRLETCISELESYLLNVHRKESEQNIDYMFALQEASKTVMNYEPILYDIHKNSYDLRFAFEPSEDSCKFLDNVGDRWAMAKDIRGSCTAPEPCSCDRALQYRRAKHEHNATAKYSGFKSFDRESCNITGCAFLENGNLLLADNKNKKVKLLDTKYKLVSVMTMPSLPWDVCAIDRDVSLVSLPDKKQLQFLGTNNKLTLKHSIRLEKNCWGIAKSGDDIIVTCWSVDASHVLIIDFVGNVKRRIQTENDVPFNTALYVTSWNDVIHVSDWRTFSVTSLTKAGATVGHYKDQLLRGPFAINTDPDGNVYVCGRDSNNVHQLSSDGQKHKILLSEADGIYKPTCACYCAKDDRLVVTLWMSDTMQVFRLK